ncbi:MAG: sugar phosphate isomerase/epimerase family protein [Actinomycetes bacterium]
MSGLRFGYGTNGFADHRLGDVLAVLADLGYDGVALTLDHMHLDPYDAGLARRVDDVASRLDALGLAVVVETGARYVLDPWHKHQPTLLSDEGAGGRDRRLDLLRRAVRIGADLGAEAVSFWSGTPQPEVTDEVAWQRLVDGCADVLEVAREHGVPLGFEPEPGMLVDTLARFDALRTALGSPPWFGLTLDIGHCRCLEPERAEVCVHQRGDVLVNVQIDDMRRGVHEHLPFGEGEVEFPPVLGALLDVGYRGLVSVELPRHSHSAPLLAARSIGFLREALARASRTEVTA